MVHHKILLLFIMPFLGYNISYSQSGVGIGTSNPNPNTILDIVSSNNDKGILIPRLTTAQRTAMNASLTSNENGLMVFDSDLDGFYFWNGTNWQSITVVQDLELVGNTLTITNNNSATDIDLSPFSGTNTDNQTLSLSGTDIIITGGNTLDLSPLQDGVNDADANPTNELQNLSSSSSGTNRTVAINGGTNATFSIADNDNSATNELQNLSSSSSGTNRTVAINGGTNATFSIADNDNSTTNELVTGATLVSGTTLRITDAGGNTDVDLSPLTGTSTDDQALTLAGNTLAIEDGGSVSLAGYLDNTDAQNLGSSAAGANRTVSISGGANTTFNINDADASTTNELQDLSSSSSGINRTVAINGGTNATFSIADNDNSATNELIIGATLIGGTTLRIADAGGFTNVNLAPLQSSGTAGGDLTGTYPNPTVAANAIGSAEIVDGSVSSADILNNTIANIDISTTAAIAGTKINPNFGGQDVQTSGEYQYLTPKAHIYAVGPSDFVVLKNFFTQDFQMIYGVSGLSAQVRTAGLEVVANFGAAIHLPDGAIVTAIEVVGSNFSASFGADIYFVQKSYSTSELPILITTIPANTNSVLSFLNSSPGIPLINNNSYNYHIRVEGSTNNGGTSGVSITGVRVTYTVTQAD